MRRSDVDTLDGSRTWWVPAVRAPGHDWEGAPGCRRGARFLIEEASCRPVRDGFPLFETPSAWIIGHRAELVRNAPGATVAPVDLAQWLLGLA